MAMAVLPAASRFLAAPAKSQEQKPALPPVNLPRLKDTDLDAVLQEVDRCRAKRDTKGEAELLLAAVDILSSGGEHQAAASVASQACALFQGLGDKLGHASALHFSAQARLAEGERKAALEEAETALEICKEFDDPYLEVALLLIVAQVILGLLVEEEETLTSSAAWARRRRAIAAAETALSLAAEIGDDPETLGCAWLCLSQARAAALQGTEAVQAALSAVKVYRALQSRHGEAYGLVSAANGYVASKKTMPAWEDASKALTIFRQLGDAQGQALAEATLDAIEEFENPERPPPQRKQAVKAPAIGDLQDRPADLAPVQDFETKNKVRAIVTEIIGMDDIVDDAPLMNMGLTSQAAVYLRNNLQKAMPGPSLPFTLMFDHPSVSGLTDFFMKRGVTPG